MNLYYSILLILMKSKILTESIVMLTSHFKCRSVTYPRTDIKRFPVPHDKVDWSSEYINYDPPSYTSPAIIGKPWADPDIGDSTFKPIWNSLDGNVKRQSYVKKYEISNGLPLNPVGRTGIKGRGVLGRWGPNHAADPVVTRWKCNNTKQILQFVAIKRRDTGEWALPGGMVDPGEKVANTAVREFQEEAINSLNMSEDEIKTWQAKFNHFFSNGKQVYKGYVDDPRNTDNAWMETVAYNFHDEDGSIVGSLNLHAGSDAVGVQWVNMTSDLKLYASHKDIIERVQMQYISNN